MAQIFLLECDVASDESIENSFLELSKNKWDKFDGLFIQ